METIAQTSSHEDHALNELLHRCMQDDRSAQSQLYARYATFLYGVVRRYVKDTDAAQEILHDAFLRIL